MTEFNFWNEFWSLAPTVFFWCALPFIILNVIGIIWLKRTAAPRKQKKIKKTINWSHPDNRIKDIKNLPVYKSKGKK